MKKENEKYTFLKFYLLLFYLLCYLCVENSVYWLVNVEYKFHVVLKQIVKTLKVPAKF